MVLSSRHPPPLPPHRRLPLLRPLHDLPLRQPLLPQHLLRLRHPQHPQHPQHLRLQRPPLHPVLLLLLPPPRQPLLHQHPAQPHRLQRRRHLQLERTMIP